jgi:hypothetical protein
MDGDDSAREATGGALEQGGDQPYEPPTLSNLGSFTELTRVAKTGPAADPGDGFQPSQV